jgi:hypothetical protein
MRSTDRPAFVGRTGALLEIVRLLRAAERGGGGQLAVLHGPAGIGKTRLAEEVAAANPAVGRHLAARVETGAVSCYRREGARTE